MSLIGSADLLDAVGVQREPIGVTATTGFCSNRPTTLVDGVAPPGNGEPDVAYQLDENAILSVPTSHLFPRKSPASFVPTSSNGYFSSRVEAHLFVTSAACIDYRCAV